VNKLERLLAGASETMKEKKAEKLDTERQNDEEAKAARNMLVSLDECIAVLERITQVKEEDIPANEIMNLRRTMSSVKKSTTAGNTPVGTNTNVDVVHRMVMRVAPKGTSRSMIHDLIKMLTDIRGMIAQFYNEILGGNEAEKKTDNMMEEQLKLEKNQAEEQHSKAVNELQNIRSNLFIGIMRCYLSRRK
jgi:hypothetical protein